MTEKYKKLYKNRGIAMGISLVGTWKVILTDGTAAQMHLPGTLDESGIGHRDVGANQWHPDAALGNAEVLQNWCRSVPEDGSTSSWRVKQNWFGKRSTGTDQIRRDRFCKSFLVADRRTGTGDECTAIAVSVQRFGAYVEGIGRRNPAGMCQRVCGI